MKKILFNIIIIVCLFVIMYIIGNKVLYPIDNINDIEKYSIKYNVDSSLVISILKSDVKIPINSLDKLYKEINLKDYNTDNKKLSEIEVIAYMVSKYKDLNTEEGLISILENNIELNRDDAKEYALKILRKKSWYKVFHYELSF